MNASIKRPDYRRGAAKQDWATPPELIEAVERRFGPLAVDLAATAANTKAPLYLTEADDSLVQPWHELSGLLWLNPPFRHIEPWAAKCAAEAEFGARIALLVLASVGTNWYRDHVHGRALVLFLNGRITFVGATSAGMNDCMIALYGEPPGFEVWKWR
jgi:phage N-6-adenine-methyltransferase